MDPLTRQLLRQVDQAASATRLRYVVVGATARDLMLVNAYGLPPSRATRDVDIGIAIENWEQFQALKSCLVQAGQFTPAPKDEHRLYWADSDRRTPIDLIPFGGVTSKDHTIAWPPSQDFVLNVAGFEEALAAAAHLRIEEDLDVPVASIPGLAVLKLIAWHDRRGRSDQDAADLACLLGCYADAGNVDRLFELELPLLEAAGFDLELAGATLLGRDAARICHAQTRRQIAAVLTSETLVDRLIIQMEQTGFHEEPREEPISVLIGRFCKGFLGG